MAGTFFIFLLISLGVQADRLIFLFLFLFVACGIAARIIAFWVEKKKNTFTVGGAAFTGILLTPLIVEGLNSLSSPPLISIIPTMAALTIAYSFGEGTGRIACISFGCCYGKPIEQMKPFTQYFFKKITFVFEGKTKKISYASGLDGHRMFSRPGYYSISLCTYWPFGPLSFPGKTLYCFLSSDRHNHTGMACLFRTTEIRL